MFKTFGVYFLKTRNFGMVRLCFKDPPPHTHTHTHTLECQKLRAETLSTTGVSSLKTLLFGSPASFFVPSIYNTSIRIFQNGYLRNTKIMRKKFLFRLI